MEISGAAGMGIGRRSTGAGRGCPGRYKKDGRGSTGGGFGEKVLSRCTAGCNFTDFDEAGEKVLSKTRPGGTFTGLGGFGEKILSEVRPGILLTRRGEAPLEL